jgi:hypothetical protein
VTGGGLSGGGPVAGTQALTFNADDGSSGVRLVQLLVDGQVVGTNDYLPRCPYQDFAACPTAITDSIAWNTANASNGPHEVTLRIVNAAQVATVIDDHLVTLHNPPHIPNGSPACESAHLTLSVNRKQRSARVRWGRPAKVTGTLFCGVTRIVDATIVVSGGGPLSTVTTNQLGSFTYVAPRGPNRHITFGYRAFADDARPAARAAVRILIVPRISLTIAPHHTVNGGSILWLGHLQGGPYPRGGVSLLAQVKEGNRWQTFDQIVAHSGRFAYRYTFLRTTQPTSYQLRVALPANGAAGYDYTSGASNAVVVHVR